EVLPRTLEGAVLLDHAVALFLRLEDVAKGQFGGVASFDERHGGDECLGAVVALAVAHDETLRPHDLQPLDAARTAGAVRPAHAAVPHTTRAELERACRGGEAVRPPPLLEVPDLRVGLEDEPSRSLDRP